MIINKLIGVYFENNYGNRKTNSITGALIAAGASIAASATGSAINSAAAAGTSHAARSWQHSERLESQAWQEAQNALQYQRNLDMWNMENEYNNPVNQVDRLIAAGVNPNNMPGMITSGNADPMTPAGGSTASPGSPGTSPVFSPLDFGLNNVSPEQLGLMNAQQKNIDQDTELKKQQTEGQNLENSVKLTDKNAEWAVKAASTEYMKTQTGLTEVQKKTAEKEYTDIMPLIIDKNKEEIGNLVKAGKQLVEQTNLIRKQQHLVDEQARTQQAEQGVLAEERSNLNKQGQQMNADVEVSKNRESIAKEWGVDVNALEGYERTNMQLRNKGFTGEQIDKFWYGLQVGAGVAVERELKSGNVLNGVKTAVDSYKNLRSPLKIGMDAETYGPVWRRK